jgi:hypothetical protein
MLSLKNIPLKSLYLVILSNLTQLQSRNANRKFMSRILEIFNVGSETGSGFEINWKEGSGSEKNHSGSSLLCENDLFTCRRPRVSIMCARAAGEGPRRCAPPVAGARQGAQILYNHWLIIFKIHCCFSYKIKCLLL